MKIYLVAPKNPESFWTFDRILPSLGKRCIFPNLSLPTVAGLTPREHEVVLCDENVEPIDFDTDADIVGLTGYVVHKKRIFEIVDEFRRRGNFVVVGGPVRVALPRGAARAGGRALRRTRPSTPGRSSCATTRAGTWQTEYRQDEKPSMHDSPLPRFDLLKVDRYRTHDDPVRARLPVQLRVLRHHRHLRPAAAHEVGRPGDGRGPGDPPARRAATSSSSTTTSSATRRRPRSCCARSPTGSEQNGYPDRVHDRGLAQRRAGRRAAAPHAAGELHHDLHRASSRPRAASLEETQEDAEHARGHPRRPSTASRRAGIQVMAGMIVGFDNDDPSIFEEQFRFIQDARIPVSMTGHAEGDAEDAAARAAEGGRAADRGVGRRPVRVHQHHSEGDVARAALRGLPRCSQRLYDYRNYRRRAMELHSEPRAPQSRRELVAGARTWRSSAASCGPASSGRRRGAPGSRLSLMIETALRRPRALREAVTLALHAQAPLRVHARHVQEARRHGPGACAARRKSLRKELNTRSDAAGAQRREQILRFAQDDRVTVTSTRPQRYIR